MAWKKAILGFEVIFQRQELELVAVNSGCTDGSGMVRILREGTASGTRNLADIAGTGEDWLGAAGSGD